MQQGLPRKRLLSSLFTRFITTPTRPLALMFALFAGNVTADEVVLFGGSSVYANNNERILSASWHVDTPSVEWIDGIAVTYGEFNGLDRYYSRRNLPDVHYYSVGAYWRFLQTENTRLQFEFAPTYLDGTFYFGHYVGTYWHFTSSLNYQYMFSNSPLYVGVGYQHTSNGGVKAPNPGIDGLGLQLGLRW